MAARINPGAFNRVFHGHGMPSWEMMESIYLAFPALNSHFLLTGEGKPLGSDQSGLEKCLAENEVLKDKLKDKEMIIELLQGKR